MADEDAFRDTHAIAQNGRGLAPVEGYRRCRVRKSAPPVLRAFIPW